MFNFSLYKKDLKSSYILLIIFMCVLTMYFVIIAGMYDPDSLDLMNMFAEMKLSPELLQALGFTLGDPSLTGFLASYFYGFLALAFPMLFYIILSNKLVAGHVDKGSMAYLLATPHTRRKIVTTQALFLMNTIAVLILFVTMLGIVFCEIKFPGMLNIGKYILINIGVLMLHFALSGICFFFSCLFSEGRLSATFGAGVPLGFFLIKMISDSNEGLKNFKYGSIFTLFNPADILAGKNVFLPMAALAFIGVVLYVAGIAIFERKDLSI